MTAVRITRELICLPERFRSCNLYLLSDGQSSILFDPSQAPDALPAGPKPQALVATHAHYDHLGRLEQWKETLEDLTFYLHEGDLPMLTDTALNASLFFGRPTAFQQADRLLAEGDRLALGRNYEILVIHTPGHTMGSCCFLIERLSGQERIPLALLTGDTLFDRAWGRTDFATGDEGLMQQSLKRLYRLLEQLPDSLPVCPGHGRITSASEACRFLQMTGFAS